MFGYLNHSLLLRAGLAMGLITALAVAAMASTVLVAHSAYGKTAAVNQAGSLRMQSYRITAAMEAEHSDESHPFGDIKKLTADFEQRLTNPRLTDVISTTSRKSIQESYQLIMDQWQQAIHPQLQGYKQHDNNPLAEESLDKTWLAFRTAVGGFVDDIDNLVRLLEEDAESRIHLLGLFQGISLFLTIAVAFATLYLLQIDVLEPMRDLLNAAEQAGSGDFNTRVAHTGSDELGRLGQTFNTMAADLSRMYSALEERVAEKTRKLVQRNQSLELLYTATQYLTEAPVSEPVYGKLLDDIRRVVDVNSITLCRKNEGENRGQRIASYGQIIPMCKKENCNRCLSSTRMQIFDSTELEGNPGILSIPIGDQKKNTSGMLLVEMQPENQLESWQIQLLETLCKHIGTSMEVTRRVTQGRRLALLEERNVMARELHDSLAQSLTYLKIQVTRLSILMRSEAKQSEVDSILIELKQGLSAAYRQLRELLTTFRLQMDGQGLGPTLSKTVEEFNAHGEIAIRLDNQLEFSPFSVNEEIHILQIVREALSNIVHHSKATQARVSLSLEDDKSIQVCIEDNGIGIPQKSERTHHYGLAIMRERASSLHADLRIEQQDQGGTKVSLKFQPAVTQKLSLALQEGLTT